MASGSSPDLARHLGKWWTTSLPFFSVLAIKPAPITKVDTTLTVCTKACLYLSPVCIEPPSPAQITSSLPKFLTSVAWMSKPLAIQCPRELRCVDVMKSFVCEISQIPGNSFLLIYKWMKQGYHCIVSIVKSILKFTNVAHFFCMLAIALPLFISLFCLYA